MNIQPAFFTLSQGDALAKILIEKGLITQAEFMQKLSDERAVYQEMLGKIARQNGRPLPNKKPIPMDELSHLIYRFVSSARFVRGQILCLGNRARRGNIVFSRPLAATGVLLA